MVNVKAAMQAVVDDLTAGGVRAVLDARDAHPPCVLVRPPTVHYRFNKGWDADFEAWAMVLGGGQSDALSAVGELLEQAQAALGGRGVTASPDDAALADGGTAPMYRITWTQRIPA